MTKNVRQCGYYPNCPHDHPALTMERARGIAARLWCLPQHANKEIDVQLAEDIAKALVSGDEVDALHVEPINLLNRSR